MKRIHIRFARCIVASVTALACVGLFPLAAAGADVADDAAQSGAQSGPQSGAQSGASTPAAPATPEAPPASPEATPDRATPATPEDTPASSDDAPPMPDPAQPEPGDPAEPAPDNPAEPEPPAPVTSQWVHHAEGWRYESPDGTWLKDGVFEVGGVRYAFNADGFVPVGWYRAPDGTWYASTENGVRTGWYRDGSWYLLSDSGAMVTGWQVSGGTRYYLEPGRGRHDGHRMDQGRRHLVPPRCLRRYERRPRGYWAGAWYYLGESGAMATGWFKAGGTWYYADASGAMRTGWVSDGGSWYYLGSLWGHGHRLAAARREVVLPRGRTPAARWRPPGRWSTAAGTTSTGGTASGCPAAPASRPTGTTRRPSTVPRTTWSSSTRAPRTA